MNTLEVKDLKVGYVYRCVISDRKVLIVGIEHKTHNIRGKEFNETLADAVVYNPVRGETEMVLIWNGQLEVIDRTNG